jgi:hypothetical protein
MNRRSTWFTPFVWIAQRSTHWYGQIWMWRRVNRMSATVFYWPLIYGQRCTGHCSHVNLPILLICLMRYSFAYEGWHFYYFDDSNQLLRNFQIELNFGATHVTFHHVPFCFVPDGLFWETINWLALDWLPSFDPMSKFSASKTVTGGQLPSQFLPNAPIIQFLAPPRIQLSHFLCRNAGNWPTLLF